MTSTHIPSSLEEAINIIKDLQKTIVDHESKIAMQKSLLDAWQHSCAFNGSCLSVWLEKGYENAR